jgi:hypothetical protein
MSDGRMFIDMTGVAGGKWVLKNNLFYFDNNPAERYGYCFSFSGLTYDEIDADYNLYYTTNAASYIVRQVTPLVRYTAAQFATMQSNWGWETHSPTPADPLFINVTESVEVDSLMIDVLSPAKDAGIGLGEFTVYDYRDSLRDENPDIGAYEEGGTNPDIPPDPPQITTVTPSVIYTRLARSGGNDLDDGGGTISAKGICWSTSANPTTSDSHTTNGTGEGAFSEFISNLKAGTIYHVRAYCTNETATVYGSDMEFITPDYSINKTGGKLIKMNGKILILK